MFEVSKRITFLREKKGYTVNKLANIAGVSQSHLRDIELGHKNPTIEMLTYICDALGISINDFFSESKDDFLSDPLIEQIYKLNSNQRKALETFLNEINK
ncbi:MAG: helix-turn-helix domain-containing protein [Lachnospiraceae bacterium]|nr:helix-turn-helix domain-containing protein [Lachnospiraceae bacterium]